MSLGDKLGLGYNQETMSDRTALRLLKRITADPTACGGKPCIRGMRTRVSDVSDLWHENLAGRAPPACAPPMPERAL
ncbi:MAG TPA: DUF433 domain-containing protein [Fimbriimonadaceae bacterium]|nr:DUF433 domain-containing protein [Fimbriimonadaceae bacterium]HRJ95261.1 DUF433 domain-containing protein [Fimbriimonadaceae bacterium]